jgi:hypothetical protein
MNSAKLFLVTRRFLTFYSLQARPPQTGFCPGSVFETPTNYYKNRKRTRELESTDVILTEEQQAVLKRE